jgi:hypothetical protein
MWSQYFLQSINETKPEAEHDQAGNTPAGQRRARFNSSEEWSKQLKRDSLKMHRWKCYKLKTSHREAQAN